MFRLKITLLSVIISGTVLIAFGLFSLGVIGRVGMERIDREILALGESQLHVWHPREHWKNFDQSLRAIYGQSGWQNLIVQVSGAGEQPLYQSPHWPENIRPALFPEFDHAMAAPGDPPAPPADGIALREPDAADRPGQARRPFGPPLVPFDGDGNPPPPPRRPQGPAQIKTPVFKTVKTATGAWRTGIMGNRHITLLVGMNLAGFYEDAQRYRNTFWLTVPLALLLLAGGGWLIAHRAMKPVALITRTAENITALGLDQRVPAVSADGELLQLVDVLNRMLDRLETSFGQAVRFSADAAHELQTPLTILQGVLDDAVQNSPAGSDEQRRYGSLLEEVQRLKSIVRKLLILARADAGRLVLHRRTVDLGAMIASAMEDAAVMAPHLTLENKLQPDVKVEADPDLLRLVIQNLTHNAVKYNHENGRIRFSLAVRNHRAHAAIASTGDPIPAPAREKIFHRFYRMDPARSSRSPGTGLGLSLAREIARAHGGELHLEPAADGLNTFTLSLPCAPTPAVSP